ncbi:MAG: hypothetical protein ABFD63_04125 [Smithella sp.]
MTDILDRWGLIARHLKVSEKTAIRYYNNRGLPITYDPAGHPITTKKALDQWKLNSSGKNVITAAQ